MWCHLGGILQDPKHYEKAWEVSGHRFAKAKRLLGNYCLKKGQLKEAIEHYETALDISALYPGVWFSLGFAAMATGDFNKALKGFTRVVQLEPENAEAWTNMASIFHQQKKM